MKKIKTIHLNYLRNEAHYEYLVVFKNLLVRFPSVKALLIAAVYENFLALLQLEGKLVDAARISDYTQKIVEADQHVDRDLVGLREAISSATHHFDPDIADAAKSLYNRMKAFGRISKKSYEEETAAVNILLTDLKGEYAQSVTAIGADVWVTKAELFMRATARVAPTFAMQGVGATHALPVGVGRASIRLSPR
jgi:hypothetical protein